MGKNALITPARFVLSFGSHKSLLSWSPPHILTPHTTLLHVEFSAENLWGTYFWHWREASGILGT